MGTLCKNCPFKHTKKEEGHCTDLFIKKYHNSCVTFDISKKLFLEKLDEFCNEKKIEKQTAPISEEVVETPNTVVEDEHKEETAEKNDVENKTTKRVGKGTKKATAKKSTVKKITEEENKNEETNE